MKQAVYFNDFRDAFMSIRPDNFSRDGLWAIYDYLTELEADTGEELELDVIAVCCDYTEDTFAGIVDAYDIDLADVDEDDIPQAIMAYLCDNAGWAVQTDSGFVYANF
jgi:hypothetical protein